jgi:hypothetical protein
MAAEFTSRDVLDQLDEDATGRRAAFFPDFDHGYYYHVDQRLTAYADRSRWVIVIEQLAVNPRAWKTGISTTLYYHGSGVELPPAKPGRMEAPEHRITVLEDGPSGPLLEVDRVRPGAADVRIRGQVIPIRTDPNYYWARAIEVESVTHEQIDAWIAGLPASLPDDVRERAKRSYESMRADVGKFQLCSWHLARGLVPEYRELLLATEEERRVGVPVGMPRLLQIDEWDHPRLMDGELPRSSEAFKSIAKVLASGDSSLYVATETPNTHWSNWARSGSL